MPSPISSSDATTEAKEAEPTNGNEKRIPQTSRLHTLSACRPIKKTRKRHRIRTPPCFSSYHVVNRRAVNGQSGCCHSAAAKNVQPSSGTAHTCRCGWPERRGGRNRIAPGAKSLHVKLTLVARLPDFRIIANSTSVPRTTPNDYLRTRQSRVGRTANMTQVMESSIQDGTTSLRKKCIALTRSSV